MATQVQGLFGLDPNEIQAQQYLLAQKQAMDFSKMDPMQAARYGTFLAGNQLGTGIAQAMGYESPEMKAAKERQGLLSGMDITNPQALREAAQKAWNGGQHSIAQALLQQANQYEAELADAQQKRAKAAKEAADLKKEEALQMALQELPADATPDQYLAVVRKFGSPDKVMTSIQTSMDRAEQRKQALELRKYDWEKRLEMAQLQGATQRDLIQMRRDMAMDLASYKASLQGSKSLTPAEIKAEEKRLVQEEGKQQLDDILTSSSALIDQIASAGGMPSTANSKTANLKASTSASSLGQLVGKVTGTDTQAKRDQLDSLRLQLLNAVAAATGMSASRLNSNVELNLWLKSLGSPGMTKEANQAIINNIRKAYLQGGGTPETPKKPQGTGTRDNPIKLD